MQQKKIRSRTKVFTIRAFLGREIIPEYSEYRFDRLVRLTGDLHKNLIYSNIIRGKKTGRTEDRAGAREMIFLSSQSTLAWPGLR